MLKGYTVEVIRREMTAHDELNEAVYETHTESVENVLIAPATTEDATERTRPDGEEVAYALTFPKTYTKSLRNCQVILDGVAYSVLGDPKPYLNCPTEWNRRVQVSRAYD